MIRTSTPFLDFETKRDTGGLPMCHYSQKPIDSICYWDKDGNTACGHKLEKKDYKYCPYCGKEIAVLGE